MTHDLDRTEELNIERELRRIRANRIYHHREELRCAQREAMLVSDMHSVRERRERRERLAERANAQ